MPLSRQMIVFYYICIFLQLVSAQTTCGSTFYSIPTARGAAFPGGWAVLTSTSATSYCKRKGYAIAGAVRTRALGSLAGKGKVAVNVGTNTTCTSPLCVAIVGVECVRAGAIKCTPDANGNLGKGNVGKDNFGTNNKGRGNIGSDNIGSLCSGSGNKGDSLTGYNLQGYKQTSPSLSSTTAAIQIGKPAPPGLPPVKPLPPGAKAPPPPPKKGSPPAPGEEDNGGGEDGDSPPSPPPSCPPTNQTTCPPCDCAPGGGLDIFDPNAPPSPPPAPATPSNDTGDGSELPSSCTNPCFKYDPENKTCSKSVCDDPCEDCFVSGTQTACLEIYGLTKFSSEASCKAGAGCDSAGKCLKCSDGKWGCLGSFRKK